MTADGFPGPLPHDTAMPDIDTLIQQLADADVAVRRRAAEALAQGSAAAAASVALVRGTRDEDEPVRTWCTAALEQCGPPDPQDVAALAGLLNHSSCDPAYWAATLLGRLGSGAQAAVADLAVCLQMDRPLAVRQRAAWALGQVGPAAAAAQAALELAARDDDPRLARLAGEALARLRR
jgi:HEAT repeat protein